MIDKFNEPDNVVRAKIDQVIDEIEVLQILVESLFNRPVTPTIITDTMQQRGWRRHPNSEKLLLAPDNTTRLISNLSDEEKEEIAKELGEMDYGKSEEPVN